MRAVLAILTGLAGLGGAAQAESDICLAPDEPPALSEDGTALDLDAFNALTLEMDRYDRERGAYVMCLNSVIFREIEASDADIDAARTARSELYVRDPETGFYSDPVLDRYTLVADAFFARQQVRATEAAEDEARASVAELDRQLEAAKSDASANK